MREQAHQRLTPRITLGTKLLERLDGDRAREEVARLREALTDVLLEAEGRHDIIARIATSALSLDRQ
ncbi:hypothetical protein [Corallococcus sp. AS-1-12]|uniref:hypothetical protein n=1 Tax=Corallococcus sp. AS-1-12 TaxID=2874598 RepID=UPI001CC170CA|nr:hypothetical protein [Corallococcus sp. AS-1-12]